MSDFGWLIRDDVHREHECDVYRFATLFYIASPASIEDAWRWAESQFSDIHHAPLMRLCPIEDLYL